MKRFNVGDYVGVKIPHDDMKVGDRGKIVSVGGPAYSVLFSGMSKPHKWYVAEELKAIVGNKNNHKFKPVRRIKHEE